MCCDQESRLIINYSTAHTEKMEGNMYNSFIGTHILLFIESEYVLDTPTYIIVQSPDMVYEQNIHSSNSAVENKSGEYKTWTANETKSLIYLYKKYRNQVGSLKIRSMKQFWEIIANLMNEELSINVTGAQCENRWRVLERNYKKYVDNNKKTGRGRKTFEYAEEFDEIFGRKRNIHPELLLTEDSAIEIPISNAVSESNEARYCEF